MQEVREVQYLTKIPKVPESDRKPDHMCMNTCTQSEGCDVGARGRDGRGWGHRGKRGAGREWGDRGKRGSGRGWGDHGERGGGRGLGDRGERGSRRGWENRACLRRCRRKCGGGGRFEDKGERNGHRQGERGGDGRGRRDDEDEIIFCFDFES